MSCLYCITIHCQPYGYSMQDDPARLCKCGCHGQAEVAEPTHDDTCECDACCGDDVEYEG